MKELFRERDLTRVSFFQSILKEEGIPTFIRNQNLAGAGLSEIPIPEFYPALCVINDDEYPAAVAIIRQHLHSDLSAMNTEVLCPTCGETNPGNFAVCWSCENPI